MLRFSGVNKHKRIISFFLTIFFLLSFSAPMFSHAAPRFLDTGEELVIVIDPGHGGKDAGACANRAMEKNIILSVALAFGRYVEQNCPDVRVIYTRKTDVFIPLHERAAIANRNKADVFVSIHTNSLPGKKPKPILIFGIAMYICAAN